MHIRRGERCRRGAIFAGAVVSPLLGMSPPVRSEEPKRATPDYDGRGAGRPPTAGEVALWVPRVLLSPAYLVSEYVVRRPLGALITTAERNNWSTALIDFFTFGPDHKARLVPPAFFDFGLHPSVGLYFSWDDALVHGHDVRLHASDFGSDWVALGASDRIH